MKEWSKRGFTLLVLLALLVTTLLPSNSVLADSIGGNSTNTIIGFDKYENSITTSKGSLSSLLSLLPKEIGCSLEDGTHKDISAEWVCDEDYESTKYDFYSFELKLPSGYSLGNGLTAWDLPYVDVIIEDTQENNSSQTNEEVAKAVSAEDTNISGQAEVKEVASEKTIQVTTEVEGYTGTIETIYGGESLKEGVDFIRGNAPNMNPCWFLVNGKPAIEDLYLSHLENGENLVFYNKVSNEHFDWFNTPVSTDMQIIGKWESDKYNVIIDDGVNPEKAIRVSASSNVSASLGVPSKPGYRFERWIDASTGNTFEPNDVITGSTIITAEYTLIDASQATDFFSGELQKEASGRCQIGGHAKSASGNTLVQVSGFEGYLKGVTGMATCIDAGHEAPLFQAANYSASYVDFDADRGEVYYNVTITPANATDVATKTGFSRCSFRATLQQNFCGQLELSRVSISPEVNEGNSLYSLAGAMFVIYDEQDNPVETLISDSTGKISKSKMLMQGKYYVKETTASRGFSINKDAQGNVSPKHYFNIVAGECTAVSIYDEPINDPCETLVYKIDGNSLLSEPKGGASLEDAIFKVTYYDEVLSTAQVKSGDYAPYRTWYFKSQQHTTESGEIEYSVQINDPNCYITEGSDPLFVVNDITTLPLGTVAISQKEVPEGYLKDTTTMYDLDNNVISKDNLVVRNITTSEAVSPTDSYEAFSCANIVKRGDLSLNKVNSDQERLSNVIFEITSRTTGESHIIMTDNMGRLSTSSNWVLHSQGTNLGRSWEDGIWFLGSVKDYLTEVDDKRGALPYDTYTIRELPSASNEGLSLVKFDVRVSEDGELLELGAVTDTPITLKTNAIDAESLTQQAIADSHVEITDKVEYSGLTKGEEYRLVSTAMDKETKTILKVDGEDVTTSTKFTAEKTADYVNTSLKFKGIDLGDKDIVIFERLYNSQDNLIASHEDFDDIEQSIKLVKVHLTTQARNKETYTQDAVADENVELIDIVSYDNLIKNNEYTLEAVVMDKETKGEFQDVNGTLVTTKHNFVAKESVGEETVSLQFDASNLNDKTLVIFETLKDKDGHVVAVHKDFNDAGQTVNMTKLGIKSEVVGKESGLRIIDAKKGMPVVNTATYNNLTPNTEYSLILDLVNAETGKALLDEEQHAISITKKFTPEDDNGKLDVEFDIDSSALAGESIAVLSTLKRGKTVISTDKELSNEKLLLNVVSIDTEATITNVNSKDVNAILGEDSDGKTSWLSFFKKAVDAITEDSSEVINEGQALKETQISDKVSYIGLTEGEEYEVEGIIYDQETGNPILVDGDEVTSKQLLTLENDSTSTTVEFSFDATKFGGHNLVVVEELYKDGKKIAEHHDMGDAKQTIHLVEVSTTALSSDTNSHDLQAKEMTSVVDKVTLTNLTIGNTYTVKGVLVDQGSKEPLKDGNRFVTGETTFTAEKNNCSVDVLFTFDSSKMAGTTAVALESIYRDDVLVASHADYEDTNQTIRIVDIDTYAVDAKTGTKVMSKSSHAGIKDTVTLTNLNPEETYTLKGIVVDKSSGSEVVIDGSKVTAEVTFRPSSADSKQEVLFDISTPTVAGATLVVFEELYDSNMNKIAEHKDINDEDQTVKVPVSTVAKKGKLVQTGERATLLVMGTTCLLAAWSLFTLLRKRRK